MKLKHSYIICSLLLIKECLSNDCVFPDYLQSAVISNELKPWKTGTKWINLRDDPQWKESREIYVQGANMWQVRENNPISCERKSRRMSNKISAFDNCSQRTLLYNRTCIQKEFNKYKVLQRSKGRPNLYICLMFIKRSDTVVQILKGPMMGRNDPYLCGEQNMYMDEWLWIASWKDPNTVCPISGGFTFRTKSVLTNQDICENDWRLSRLEVECLHGDGLHFMAPKGSDCNPFSTKSEFTTLHCWAGWEQSQYIFMIASAHRSAEPQYCLRFPKDMSGEFTVHVYFSVICPIQEDGKPITGIAYYELHMRRQDPGECKDESEKYCKKHSEKGICEKPHNKFVPHCKKTCNICEDIEQLTILKCPFDAVLRGTWILYDNGRQESLTINATILKFSKSGSFICHSRTREDYKYRLISVFNNGCSTRYSCIEIKRRQRNVLQYRLGKSTRENMNNEDTCVFRDDPYPKLDSYRSFSMKNLILSNINGLWYSYCGFEGEYPFYGIFKGENCTGTFSDWNENLCKPHGQIEIKSDTCVTLRNRKYQCLLYLEGEMGFFDKQLITRSLETDEFNCWYITRYHDASDLSKNTVIHQMPNPQCSAFTGVSVHVDRPPKSSLFLDDSKKQQRCVTPAPTTIFIDPNEDLLTTTPGYSEYGIENPSPIDSTVILKNPQVSQDSKNSAAITKSVKLYILLYISIIVFRLCKL